jgi:hypothetical protein
MKLRDDDEMSESDDGYQVGYRKPPKQSRFKPGRSGNPQGKPRGTKNALTLLKRALLEPVLVKRNGRETKATKLRVIVTQLVNQAMKGDYFSILLLLRYAGLDRQLNKTRVQQGGISREAADAITCALTGEPYPPPIPRELPKHETWSELADTKTDLRSDEGNRPQTYRVGYGKPPTHTRFQKGRSGNPAGRPRAPKTLIRLIQQLLGEDVSIAENGREQILSRLEVILKQIVNKAALGNSRFQALLLVYAPALDVKVRRRRGISKNEFEIMRKSLLDSVLHRTDAYSDLDI